MREAVCALEILCAERGGLGGLRLLVGDLLWLLGVVVVLLVVVVVSRLLRSGERGRRGRHLGVCV